MHTQTAQIDPLDARTITPMSTGNGIVWITRNGYGNEIARSSTRPTR